MAFTPLGAHTTGELVVRGFDDDPQLASGTLRRVTESGTSNPCSKETRRFCVVP
jgi:hypothetical protein